MKLLVIGGSQFVGRHLVEAAVTRGDTVTVFNRGLTASALPTGVEHRRGDRQGSLDALADGSWDAVVDCCGYLPADVARMAGALQGRVGRYVLVSSVAAYARFDAPNDEQGALGHIDDVDTSVVDGRTYGPLKGLCEAALARHFEGETLVVRPGLVVGPHDPTQRFTYWPVRTARAADGEAVLVPGTPDDPVQFIDARDLAKFLLGAIDAGLTGCFNAASAPGHWRFGDLLAACALVADRRPRWVWHDAAALLQAGVEPWIDLPLWMPRAEYAGFMRTDTRAAEGAGLPVRPLAETVADVLAWHAALPEAERAFSKAGLSPARETELLAALG